MLLILVLCDVTSSRPEVSYSGYREQPVPREEPGLRVCSLQPQPNYKRMCNEPTAVSEIQTFSLADEMTINM